MLRRTLLSYISTSALIFLSVVTASSCRAEVDSPEPNSTSELSLTTERVIVFKDGYCLVVKNGTATTDENGTVFTDDVPESAILGSFWVTATQGELESTVAGWNEERFVLKTEGGKEITCPGERSHLSIEGLNLEWEKRLVTKEKKKRLKMNFAQPNKEVELSLIYFRPDVRWIPTYKIQLTDEPLKNRAGQKRAELMLQGELLNEAEDFIDVPFHVVVGVPNFRFKSVPSPMIMEATVRKALASAAPQIMGNQVQLMNSMYTQRSSESRGSSPSVQAPATSIEMPDELTSSAGNDLFVYQLKEMTLKKGERATVPILKTDAAYRDIYTWQAHIVHAQAGPDQIAQDDSPLILGAHRVWRQVEMINDTEFPWTTGAAMFVDGFQPLAQELLTYTSPGGICRVPVTVSVDLRAKVTDGETNRDRNSIKWQGKNYAKITGKMEAELTNNKATAVDVEVELNFGGRANKVSNEGEKILRPFQQKDWNNGRYFEVNNSSTVTWKTKIQSGESFKPTIDYHYFIRH